VKFKPRTKIRCGSMRINRCLNRTMASHFSIASKFPDRNLLKHPLRHPIVRDLSLLVCRLYRVNQALDSREEARGFSSFFQQTAPCLSRQIRDRDVAPPIPCNLSRMSQRIVSRVLQGGSSSSGRGGARGSEAEQLDAPRDVRVRRDRDRVSPRSEFPSVCFRERTTSGDTARESRQPSLAGISTPISVSPRLRNARCVTEARRYRTCVRG